MHIQKKILKGVQDIRTYAGRGGQAFHPYKAYMRISCLEMEKARRGKERESAMHRVNNIDARFKEIEAEKATILEFLGKADSGDSATTARVADPTPARRGRMSGFKIRY